MNFSAKPLSQTITQLCLIKGIDHVVISPGSRSAPLTIGFTQNPGFNCFAVVDERCAAFTALGMAQQLERPVALVCTSGSALLNYYPAIAEAFYSDIPLVVLSADRPPELIDRGDGQTIRQENVFANHILYSAQCQEGEEHQLQNETLINVALNTAVELNGPVHLNLPFSEPLYGVTADMSVRPQHVPVRLPERVEIPMDWVVDQWMQAEKKMVLSGVLPPAALNKGTLDRLLLDPSVLLLSETTSNIPHSASITAIDQLIAPLSESEFSELRPDLLITIGGMVVSKKIKAFLRKHQPKVHIHVDPKKAYDTFFALDRHIKVTPQQFFDAISSEHLARQSSYKDQWIKVKNHRLQLHDKYMREIPFSDFLVHQRIYSTINTSYSLQLANSTAIRYSQLFDLSHVSSVYCNRGTSGIDGSNSTAIGMAMVSESPVLLVTGDLSFFYDSNAFWNDHIPASFRVILLNNSGGGIFRILPNAKETDKFEQFFETKHPLNAGSICQMHGLDYQLVSDSGSLEKALDGFYEDTGRARILEVDTSACPNDEILLNYFEFIR
ncbi:2-succinyl-5-enolpyruvyl-6-hydroxy-3-cyclohexene-1-carboxylic-acid synthase [Aureitalea marina]|uniref:2-succinyl-5-enolpyruvyl-6-hydroxy-3-cyclohexene-1-carboxylate synthase n=1 Tax=Aureitalea marina TaxID=930804 RepID=A0A2S7KNQ8_9FLAO|nr:2-succinyl-5-enolpyruvyl-6-hydroxy-3-cyclohexene-1-carboxylic-acid synthase [Aureitalea marina]PQB04203.1 2-succinyl-5-enolpyruvyl-6-hydroxy-3-cyclohexene-1-carboxylic-acid synthase [Aureitalea marina]